MDEAEKWRRSWDRMVRKIPTSSCDTTGFKYDTRGHSIARATTNKGSAPWALGPNTCHTLIMIRVYVNTSIQLSFGPVRVR